MRRALILIPALLISIVEARADHHLLERALQESRCIPKEVRQVTNGNMRTIYEVECRQAKKRYLTVICSPVRCIVDAHGDHDDEDNR